MTEILLKRKTLCHPSIHPSQCYFNRSLEKIHPLSHKSSYTEDSDPENEVNDHVVFKAPHMDDGWMTCTFTSFSTVFQSQDDGQMIMKGYVHRNLVYG